MLLLYKVPGSRVFIWSGASVTLTWISFHPSRWKEYVRNRVLYIQENSGSARWRHISRRKNPADCASRGVSAQQL